MFTSSHYSFVIIDDLIEPGKKIDLNKAWRFCGAVDPVFIQPKGGKMPKKKEILEHIGYRLGDDGWERPCTSFTDALSKLESTRKTISRIEGDVDRRLSNAASRYDLHSLRDRVTDLEKAFKLQEEKIMPSAQLEQTPGTSIKYDEFTRKISDIYETIHSLNDYIKAIAEYLGVELLEKVDADPFSTDNVRCVKKRESSVKTGDK